MAAAQLLGAIEALPVHRLTVESSHGGRGKLYWPVCSCEWMGGDCRTEAEARRQFVGHL